MGLSEQVNIGKHEKKGNKREDNSDHLKPQALIQRWFPHIFTVVYLLSLFLVCTCKALANIWHYWIVPGNMQWKWTQLTEEYSECRWQLLPSWTFYWPICPSGSAYPAIWLPCALTLPEARLEPCVISLRERERKNKNPKFAYKRKCQMLYWFSQFS